MAVPTRKTSRTVTRQRRSHHRLTKPNLVTCSNCQELILPHQVCAKCGHYHGKQILEVEE